MSDKPIRLHCGCRDGSSFWTEPLGFVDAKVLAQMLATCGMAVAWHQNNRTRHRQIEALFAAAASENIASMKWLVGCGCDQCGNKPSECRIVRIAPPAPGVQITVLPDSTGSSSLTCGSALPAGSLGEPVGPSPLPGMISYLGFVDSVLATLGKALGLPGSLFKGKEGGHAS